MGINPNIPLAGQQPQIEGPIDLQKGALSVQYLINAAQLQKQQQAANAISQQQQQLELQQQQQAVKDQQAFNKAYMDAGGDWDKAIQGATTNGVSGTYLLKAQAARADQLAKLATMNKEQLSAESVKIDNLGRDAIALKKIDDPQERQQAYIQLRNSHLLSGAYKASELPASVPSDHELDSLISHSKAAQDMLKEAADLQEKNAKLPGEQAEALGKRGAAAAQMMNGALNQIAWTARRNLVNRNDPEMASQIPENYSPEAAEQVKQLGISPEKIASTSLEKQSYQQWAAQQSPGADKSIQAFQLQADVAKQKALLPGELKKVSAEAAARGAADIALMKNLQQQSQQGGRTTAPGMSPEATDSAATTYHNTGKLPPLGRGGAAGRAQQTAIMNRERELFPGTVASADSAIFGSYKSTLADLQKKATAMNAFEETAGKNLDVFLTQAKKAVDTGLPILNLPVRMVAGKLGSENQAAFDTARTTAVTEISRVLNSPTGSGVVSDSARHEVEGLIKGDATLGQIMSAASILKQDMKNRHDSYQDQINALQEKLKGGGSGGSGQPKPTHRWNPTTNKIEEISAP